MYRNRKVGVLMGGPSAEREVSLKTGRAVADALRAKGYRVVELDLNAVIAQELVCEGVDVIYNALHGKWGEDGCVQGLLEILGIPYTGPGVMASAVGMDKVVSKRLFIAAGLPVPAFQVMARKEHVAGYQAAFDFGFPVVVKPANEGSSVGIEVIGVDAQLPAALGRAFEHDERVVLEQYIRGREMSVAVLGDTALGIVEIRPKPVEGQEFTFYDYAHKYTKGMTDYITKPESLPPEADAELRDLAVAANRVIAGEGVVRVDFILDEQNRPWLLEVNTLPGLTELSLVPMIARDWQKIEFGDLVELVLNTARLKVGV